MLTRKSSSKSSIVSIFSLVLLASITHTAWGAADLAPTTPVGWPGPIVVSTVAGTNADSVATPPYSTADFLFIDFAVKNQGDVGTGAFKIYLEVDGVVVASIPVNLGLAAGGVFTSLDNQVGPLSRGTHNIRVIADPTNPPFTNVPNNIPAASVPPGDVSESDETNNAFVRSLQVKFPLPTISSGAQKTSTAGQFFSYAITASGNPTSFNASSLPSWLSINTGTGVISGTPPLSATTSSSTPYTFTVFASNLDYTGQLDVTLTVVPQKPTITSPLTVTGQLGVPFSYVMTTTGSPSINNMAPNSIADLVWNPTAQTYSGVPTQPGTFFIVMTATNDGGSDVQQLQVIISGPPVFTSKLTDSTTANSFYSYQIVATGNPSFFPQPPPGTLPPGLTLNSSNGIISGVASVPGTYTIPLSATNAFGSGTATLVLGVKAGNAPAIVSPLAIYGQVGARFYYKITASETPASWPSPDVFLNLGTLNPAVTYNGWLPPGLDPFATRVPDINGGAPTVTYTGEITGIPVLPGTWTLDVTVTTPGGSVTETLTIYIEPVVPKITSPLFVPTQIGTSFSYQITASGGPTSYGCLFDVYPALPSPTPGPGGAGSLQTQLSFDPSTGIISGTPIGGPNLYWAAISATNASGTSPIIIPNSSPGEGILAIGIGDPNSPIVNSPTTQVATVGKPFNYQITATGVPNDFSADLPAERVLPLGPNKPPPPPPLPPGYNWPLGQIGLTINTTTGAITGTPTVAGTHWIRLSAAAGGARGFGLLVLTVGPSTAGAPVITNANAVIGKTGQFFQFFVTATNNPTMYTVGNLPPELTVSANGVISGTVTADLPPTDVTITATNAAGTSATFHLTMVFYDESPSKPTINSPATTTASETIGYNYTVSATQNATSIVPVNVPNAPQAASLPSGLSIGAVAGSSAVISGTPDVGDAAIDINGDPQPQKYWLLMEATGGTGTGYGIVLLTVNPSPPAIMPSDSATTYFGLNIPQIRQVGFSATGVVGEGFSYQIVAPRLSSPNNYDANAATFFNSSQLPAGLSVDYLGQTAGLINGTPTDIESDIVRVSALNSTGADTREMQIASTRIIITSPIYDSAVVGNPYSYQIKTETKSPFMFDVQGLPPGLNFDASTGLISGVPLVSSDPSNPTAPVRHFLITLYAWNSAANVNPTNPLVKGSQVLALKVSQIAGSPVITSATTYTGVDKTPLVPYQITATNPPLISFDATMADGKPLNTIGLSVDPQTGIISGNPTQYGNFNIVVTAKNAQGTGGQTVSLKIDPLKPNMNVPPTDGVVGRPFAYDISYTGSEPIRFTTTTLPAGLTISGNQIRGTPTQAGPVVNGVTQPFVVTVTASGPADTDQKDLLITIYQLPAIPANLTATGTIGVPFTFNFAVTGSPDQMVITASPLPNGLSFNGSTTISGIPTQSGVTTITLTASNLATTKAGIQAAMQTMQITILPMQITNPSLVIAGTKGVAITPFIVTATGNPNSFSAVGLPLGLSINSGSGAITGIPAVSGTFQATVTASNGVGSASGTLIVAISDIPGAPAITSPLTAAGTANRNFTYQIKASNMPTNPPAGSFNAVPVSPSPSLAALGLTLDTATGQLSGTLTTAGTFAIQISATNGIGTGSAILTLGVSPVLNAPAIISLTTASGMVGAQFTYQIVGTNSPTAFTATIGGNPLSTIGLSVDSVSGLISGIPNLSGTFVVHLTASNQTGTGFADLTLTIIPSQNPVINSPLSVTGTVGIPMVYAITATALPTSFGATNLPPGLTVDSGTGLISGTPLLAGIYATVISASNASGTGTATVTFNIGIATGVPTITSPTTATGTVGGAFTYQITGSLSPTSFDAVGLYAGNVVGALPVGLAVNTTTGAITGTPNATGNFNIIVLATNGAGTGSAVVALTVVSTIPVITSATEVDGNVGVPLTYQITAVGIQPISFSVSGLPPGLTFSGNTIVGNPTTEGTYPVSIDATNSVTTTTTVVTFVIGPPIPPTIVSPSSTVALTQVPFSFTVVVNGSQPYTLQATGLPPGLILAGSSITGVPSTVGSFAVTLTATNVAGTTTQTLVISVFGITPNVDSDGDGFPDELEFFLGTDPLNANSTPFRGAPANADPFHLAAPKLSVKLDFVNLEKDTLTLTGTLPLPAGFTAPGQRMVVDIGGVLKEATLDRRGSFTSSDKKTSMKLNASKSRASGVNAKYAIKLRGTFRQQLSDEGLNNVAVSKSPRDIILILLVGEVAYQKTTTVLYSCKNNKANAR